MSASRDAPTSWAGLEGLPFPLGATWVAAQEAWNFAVYSEHAEQVTLLLYTEADPSTPVVAHRLDHLRNKSGPVWHCRVPVAGMKDARFYAYQVDGARSPHHRFDPDKVLFDPYARALHFPPGFDRKAAIGPGANAGRAPLGLIAADRERFDWGGDRRPRHEAGAVIYELHVRGFTTHPSSGVPAERRGTFAALIDRIPYLLELGVTVVELMPVFQFDPGEGNYWGYNPISFFAPHDAYAHRCDMCDQHTEFRELVRAFHAAGLEVVLDVVYNHTGEGNHAGPVYSFKGLDNDTGDSRLHHAGRSTGGVAPGRRHGARESGRHPRGGAGSPADVGALHRGTPVGGGSGAVPAKVKREDILPASARAFVEFVQSDDGAEILMSHGYLPVR